MSSEIINLRSAKVGVISDYAPDRSINIQVHDDQRTVYMSFTLDEADSLKNELEDILSRVEDKWASVED